MAQALSVLVYPVKDIESAKALYSSFLGCEPYVASPYYTGFRIGDQEIGLVPNAQGQAGPIGYRDVDDIKAVLQTLLDAGWQPQQDVQDVGGGLLVAQVRDADGNVVGLRQSPKA